MSTSHAVTVFMAAPLMRLADNADAEVMQELLIGVCGVPAGEATPKLNLSSDASPSLLGIWGSGALNSACPEVPSPQRRLNHRDAFLEPYFYNA